MTSLPPLARVVDLEQRLGRTFDDTELTQVEAWLDDASAMVRLEAGRDWVTDDEPPVVNAPPVARLVALKAVERVLRNPDGLSSESAGDYSYQRNAVEDGGGIYLTDREVKLIRRAAGRSGLWTQPTTRNEYCQDTVWLNDSYGLEPFPIDSIPLW